MALPKLYEQTVWHNNTSPALNEDNLNSMSQAIDDIDDRVIELAGTIMEDVPEIREDLEILRPAIESIEENVEAAAESAEASEASALKSEGYAIGEQDGVEVGPDSEYYQNNAKYYAEIANPPIENTVDFTDIITISDAINKAAKDVRLKVEAVQDLHGYTKPWPGGAGKNKLPLTLAEIKSANIGTWSGNTITRGNVQFTVLVDSDDNVLGIKIYGTPNANTNIALCSPNTYKYQQGNYKVSGCTGGSGSTFYLQIFTNVDYTSGAGIFNPNGDTNVTLTAENTMVSCLLHVRNGAGLINTTVYPMLRDASADATYEPYTNICPISGWDNAKVTRGGKNLFDNVKAVSGYYLKEDGTTNASGSWNISNYIKVSGSVVMSTSAISSGNSPSICWYDKNKNFLGGEKYSNRNTVVVSLPTNAVYVRISFYNDWVNITQLELGTTPTTFEPYQGIETTISLNGTRYGGTLDVTSGVLTVKGVYADLSTFSWTLMSSANRWQSTDIQLIAKPAVNNQTVADGLLCDYYEPTNNDALFSRDYGISIDNGGYLRCRNGSTEETPTGHIVYELATPITVQLTAAEVYLLYGYNTLFGDCGDISLTYDASGIVHIEEAKLDTETLKTIAAASSDFADFKARIAAL